jgi:hypothetical protein
MWHVRAEIAPAVLLVVDFGGWWRLDSKSSRTSSQMIHHTQVSLLKDVIVPYTHLLPTLSLSENKGRPTLLYFKGARHRHRVCTFFITLFSSLACFLFDTVYLKSGEILLNYSLAFHNRKMQHFCVICFQISEV